MGAIDNAAKLRATALAAINAACLGEDFGFDATLTIGQAPGGQTMVVYTLILTKKNPLLGQGPLTTVTHLPSSDPTPEQVEHAVGEAMKGLRELTTKILTDSQQTSAFNR